MTEGNGRVGKLGAKEAIHNAVIVSHMQEAPEHVNRLVVRSIYHFEVLLVSQQNVDNDVLGCMSLKAFVDRGKDIEVPDGAAVKPARAHRVFRCEETSVSE